MAMEGSTTCPVPREQQPMEEYQALKESGFFSWPTLGILDYLTKLFWILSWSSVVTGNVAAVSFTPQKYLVQFLLLTAGGAVVMSAIILLRLYLGWAYIRGRLFSEAVFYEESGWYDGQTWTKPPETLDRDRLIVSYEIQPILQRLHQTFAVLGLLLLSGTILWYLL